MNPRIPGADGRRTLIRDLRNGHAGWVVRLGLSVVAAAALLAVAMVWMGMLEVVGGRLRDEHIALTMGAAGATWCGVLALLWWSFRRFQVFLKAAFLVLATWAIVMPTGFLIDSVVQRGEEYLIAAVVFLGIAFSVGSVILICYHRYRAGPAARAIVHVRMACPECGYSLVGLTDCRCPECGAEYTVETLIEALGRGQVMAEVAGVVRTADELPAGSAPVPQLEPPAPGGARPQPEPT